MMQKSKMAYLLGGLLFTVILFLLVSWNNYRVSFEPRQDQPIKLPPAKSGQCQMTNCHGLEVTCGVLTEPLACTMIYQPGDNCRQFVSCQSNDGQCQLVESPKFATCKKCVEDCQSRFPDSPEQFFQCESQCWQ